MKIKQSCPARETAARPNLAPTPSEMYPIAERYKKGRAKTALDHRRDATDPNQGQLLPPTRSRRNIVGKGGYA